MNAVREGIFISIMHRPLWTNYIQLMVLAVWCCSFEASEANAASPPPSAQPRADKTVTQKTNLSGQRETGHVLSGTNKHMSRLVCPYSSLIGLHTGGANCANVIPQSYLVWDPLRLTLITCSEYFWGISKSLALCFKGMSDSSSKHTQNLEGGNHFKQ